MKNVSVESICSGRVFYSKRACPKRHAPIDRWLRALFGSGYDAAAQWLASCSDLTRPAPCLYLIGGGEIGKSLLVSGLAKLWGSCSGVPLREAVSGRYVARYDDTALVFDDSNDQAKCDLNDLRLLLTRPRQPTSRYSHIEGCLRILLTDNSSHMLLRKDLSAISDRLLVAYGQEDACTVLEERDQAQLSAWAEREIAEHVLWLAATIELEKLDWFCVRTPTLQHKARRG